MAINKKDIFNKEEQEIAAFAKAIAHPARVAILKVLAERNECICGDIVEVLPLAQSTVSQHLKELKDAGLIKGTIDGPRSCYCINWEILASLLEQFNALFGTLQLNQGKTCC
ncbi:metalloregulator ArsR/SmtB family transcription factor [Flavihumibacter rivuli]|uniref:ArsR/SmtB family transcription factor n=1 Tax=Flavihumibacter rivuli TaxID=2838156 RepID=UPI001BDE94E2|nr:metalloregulator ArsR/SmtB family transcription factor [Flavihumibacter rivuli]ULQ55688.1 metalloregulator ArsR/SmtB family transcription factor [Flavihumibacter rivuli]